jgi:ABC-type transport system involved in multi-copper enzyme maturation permease subunit
LLSVLVIGLTVWGFARLHGMAVTEGRPPPTEAPAAYALLVAVLAQMFSFVLAVGAAFLAAPSIAGDVESGIALVILPRPIRRSDFVLGKWLGLSALLTLYVAGVGGCELVAVNMVTGYAPPHPVIALGFIALQAIALLTLSLALSTRMAAVTGGVVALVLFGIAWIAQVASSLASLYHNTGLAHACTAISLLVPTGELWRGAAFALEPVLVAAMSGTAAGANPITVPTPPTTAFMVWVVCWLVAVLAIAVRSFDRRDV